ncbi:MAG TPA: thioesterase family protein [Caulobacterales bacterium]|nr:thioesterase family protein [Caulobacterales bacterium]
MHSALFPGLTHMQTLHVDESLTVPSVSKSFTGFRDMPPVFATAFMVGFIEWACVEALRPYLDSGEHSVGTHIDVSHAAATPVGMRVTATVQLIAVDGRKLRFKVSARDEFDLIGEGYHDRVVIDQARFMRRVSRKAAQAA